VTDIATELQSFSALESLSEEQLEGLALNVRSMKYRNGSWLCREGDLGTCCYFLLSGTVSVSKQLEDGRKVYLCTLIAGHLFGQTGLIPQQLRTADVTAGSDVEVLVLERERLETALRKAAGWATALQTIIASHLVRQLRSALGRLETLAGQEDAESEAEGRKHSEVAKPRTLKIEFKASSGRARPTNEESSEKELVSAPEPDGEHEPWEELPPPIDPTREELYELLQATEAGLGSGTDYQLQTVRVVIDEDAWGRRAL